MFQILIADNDRVYRRRAVQTLKSGGYQVIQSVDGEDVLKNIKSRYIDVVVLGTDLDDVDIYELVKQLRDAYPDVVIIMMASEQNTNAVKKGFTAGVDEFLIKSVDDDELLLRMRALLRRAGKSFEKRLKIGEVELDGNSFTVTRGREKQILPRKEFWLLFKLLSHPGNIFTRAQLINEIWGISTEASQPTLSVHINRLRKKIPRLSGV